MTAKYEVTVIRELDDFQAVLPEWRNFSALSPPGSSFDNDPEIVASALSHKGSIPYIIMVRRAGRLQCVAPFCIHASRFGLRLSVFQLASLQARLLKLCGDDFLYAAGADAAKCCSLVFEAIDFGKFDLVYFEALDTRSQLWEYCAASNGRPTGLRFIRPARALEKSLQIALPPTFAEYLSMLSAGTRYTRKRDTKKLLADHGATLVRITTADQVPSFLNDVDAIYRDSWQAKTYGYWKRNSDEEIARFKHIASRGWLRSYVLVAHGVPMAFLIGHLYRSSFYIPAWAFAQKWSHLGPGAVLVYLTIEDIYKDTPPGMVDLGYGDSAIKRSFRGSPHDVGDYYVTPGNRWHHLVAAQRGLSEIETVARNALIRTGLDNAVRRLLKHKR